MEDILELIWCNEAPAPNKEDLIPIEEILDQEGRRKVRLSDQTVDFFRTVPQEEKTELLGAFQSLADDPCPPDVLGIEGTLGNYRAVKPGRR